MRSKSACNFYKTSFKRKGIKLNLFSEQNKIYQDRTRLTEINSEKRRKKTKEQRKKQMKGIEEIMRREMR